MAILSRTFRLPSSSQTSRRTLVGLFNLWRKVRLDVSGTVFIVREGVPERAQLMSGLPSAVPLRRYPFLDSFLVQYRIGCRHRCNNLRFTAPVGSLFELLLAYKHATHGGLLTDGQRVSLALRPHGLLETQAPVPSVALGISIVQKRPRSRTYLPPTHTLRFLCDNRRRNANAYRLSRACRICTYSAVSGLAPVLFTGRPAVSSLLVSLILPVACCPDAFEFELEFRGPKSSHQKNTIQSTSSPLTSHRHCLSLAN